MLHKSNGNVMTSEETLLSKPSLPSDKKTDHNSDGNSTSTRADNHVTDNNFRQEVEPADDIEDGKVKFKKKHTSILEASNPESTSSSSNNECSDEDERLIKRKKRNQSDDVPVVSPPESDAEEEDVKVCDICGDAGREDLLAVCNRCSDGAEHTYCMREMLDKVPEGDWLCEECKSNELLEARKVNHSKKLGNHERIKSPGQTSSLLSDFSLKLDGKDTFCERPKLRNVSLHRHSKRPGERMESCPAAKQQTLESNMDSPTASSPSQTAVLSKDSLFKTLDKIKGKPSNQLSRGTEVTEDSYENGLLATTNSLVRKGNIMKSKSFSSSNSKQNVKVSEDVIQKQGVDSKEGIGKLMGKSTSFKGLGRSSSIEPKVKMLLAKCAPAQDVKGQKHGRDRTSYERKSTIKLDNSLSGQMTANPVKRPSVGSDGITTSSATIARDYKSAQIDGKLSTMSKHSAHLTQKSSDIMPNLGDVKKPYATGIIGSTSVNGAPNALESQLNNFSVKDGSMVSPSRHADRLLHADGARAGQDSQSEKPPSSRQGLNNRMASGNRRKLPSDASALKTKDGLLEENKLKAALEAAMQKKQDIFKKIKIPEKPTMFSKGYSERDAVSNDVRDSVSEEPMHEGDMDIHDNNLNSSKQMPISGAKQVDPYPVRESVLTLSAIPEQESVWQGGFEIHRNGKLPDMCVGFQAHMSICATSKVLEMVGNFPKKIIFNEVPRPCAWPVQFRELGAQEDNIALYFFAKDSESYMRSYKILVDYMMKHDLALRGNINGMELLVFPSNHLPHKSKCWNALYFIWGIFRGKRHRILDDRFCSLGKREISDSETAVLDKDIASAKNPCLYKPATEQLSISGSDHTSVSGCEAPVVVGPSLQQCASSSNGDCNKEESSSGGPCLKSSIARDNQKRPKNYITSLGEACSESGTAALREECQQDPNRTVGHHKLKGEIDRGKNLPSEIMLDKQDSPLPSKLPLVGKQEITDSDFVNKMKSDNSLKQEKQCLVNKQNSGEMKFATDDKKGDTSHMLKNGIKLWSDGDLRCKGYVDINVSADGNVDDLCRPQYSPRRHFHEDSVEPISLAAATIACKKRPWVDRINLSEDEDQASPSQSLKVVDKFSGCNLYGRPSTGDRLEVSSSSRKEDISDEADDKKSTAPNLRSAKGRSYLVDSDLKPDIQPDDGPFPLEVALLENNDSLPVEAPNLELALGVKRKQAGEGISRFFAGAVDRPPDLVSSSVEGGGDANASLSLSLGFPYPVEERMAWPENPSKTVEQTISERHEINTSLLLFRGTPGK